ncbi:MAG TPA: hypothetical protein VLF71_05535 [Candidatus Saccharimonadales bacterium]|nr:hypothetical protein [Candidatus Saccharimonadales bacterium]
MRTSAFSRQPQPQGTVLRRYRLGLGAIALFTLFVVVAVLVMASGAKQDTKTEEAANQAATKIDDYINNKQAVPDSLAAAGVTNAPRTITYKKLSDRSYRFCATYKAASSGIETSGVTDVVSRGLYGMSGAPAAGLGAGDSTSDFLYVSPAHKKGANCQLITPYMPDSTLQQGSGSLQTITDPKQASVASGAQDTACDISGYGTHYSGVVKSVATTDGGPIIPTVSQDIVVHITPNGGTVTGDQTVEMTAVSFNVFDSLCTAHDHAGISVGDDVSVFLANSDQYMPGTIVDFSFKR